MVLVIGKLFISTSRTAAYFTLVDSAEVELYSDAGPALLIFIIIYFVADVFMEVFEIGILTSLDCFVADEEMFVEQTRYAEGRLKSWVDDNGAFSNDCYAQRPD